MTEASNTPSATAPAVHNGTYTVSHPERGHFTLKLYTAKKGALAGKRILAILVGPDNESNYQGCAFWDDEKKCAFVWKRFKGPKDIRIDGYHWSHEDQETKEDGVGMSSQQKKLAIWADLIIRGFEFTGEGLAPLPTWETGDEHEMRDGQLFVGGVRKGTSYWRGEGYEIQLAGYCVVCNRKLTDPTSIARGIGPVCEGRS